MKRQFTSIVLAAGLSVIGSLTLSAQDRTEVAEIPFSYTANQTQLPAGTYRVDRGNQGVFRLSDGKGHAIFMNAPIQQQGKADNPHLTFARFGDEYLLAQIWSTDGTGYSVSQSALDKERPRGMQVASMISVKLHR